MDNKVLIKVGSITPSAVLLGLFYIDNYSDFLFVVPVSWLIAYFYSVHVSFSSAPFRHFFSVLSLFVGYSVLGFFNLFPFPHFYDKSPLFILALFTLVTALMIAFLVCCTRLYTFIEGYLIKRFIGE